jgi:hypothetical protein
MEVCLIELSTIIATEGIKSYLKHRKKMIEEGREDELASVKIKKYLNTINMSSRGTTPNRQSIDTEISLESIYEDEKEGDEEENRKSITEAILRSMPIKQPQKRVLLELIVKRLKVLLVGLKLHFKKYQR